MLLLTKHILFKSKHCTFKFKVNIGVTICQLVHLIKNRRMETFDLLLGCQLISDLLESWGESCSLDLV